MRRSGVEGLTPVSVSGRAMCVVWRCRVSVVPGVSGAMGSLAVIVVQAVGPLSGVTTSVSSSTVR